VPEQGSWKKRPGKKEEDLRKQNITVQAPEGNGLKNGSEVKSIGKWKFGRRPIRCLRGK